ncbi:MAG TPA: TetR/AcrR family transcriptional regulator [Pseudonocardia sp.]|jgi:AcrR family transcriptional regulator|nr:TetR/AcrR family transcriptional regulator [Pseudonocardia sp.]
MAPPRRSERLPYTVDTLTDVAVGLFTTRGYDATRVEHIAKAANISKSSVYHHVSGKEDLLRQALERAVRGLWAVFDEPGAREGDPLARLIHIMRETMAVQLRLQPEMALLLRIRGNTATERWALEERDKLQRRCTDLVAEAQAAGQLRTGRDPALLVHLAFSMSNSLVEWFRPDGTWSHREVVDALLEVMLDGTRPHP